MRGNRSEKAYFSAFTINIVFILMMIAGVAVLPRLSLTEHISRPAPSISLSYSWPYVSARAVEQNMTSILEGALGTLHGLRSITSSTYDGGGSITLTFDKDIDMRFRKYEVTSILRSIAPRLPEGASMPGVSVSGAGAATEERAKQILIYNLNANANTSYIAQYAEENIKTRLALVEGVENVSINGATSIQWEIVYDDNKLFSAGLTSGNISSALRSYMRENEMGAALDQGPGGVPRKTYLTFRGNDADSIVVENIPIGKSGNRIITLGDVATVRLKERQPSRYFRINGLNTITLTITAEKGSNHIKVASEVKDLMIKISNELPPEYTTRLQFDSTITIKEDINKIVYRTIFSALLLLLFVLIISRQLRYLLVISISLAANISIAFFFYYIFNINLHLQSLVGITVSFGIIIDNTIVMTDHLRHYRNKRVFLAIFAATLTTIGALSVIFFLSEQLRFNLVDFAAVIIINLSVSLFTALFLIPALLEKIDLSPKYNSRIIGRKRRVIRLTSFYDKYITTGRRFRWAFITVLILAFGLPVGQLPTRLPKPTSYGVPARREQTKFDTLYNKTIGSQEFNRSVRPIVDKALGGTLRLFSNNIEGFLSGYGPSGNQDRERTRLNVNIELSQQGLTIENFNEVCMGLENMITAYDEVETFTSSINSYRQAYLNVYFKPEHDFTIFPYILKMRIESYMQSIGSYSTLVTGVGRAFSNRLGSESIHGSERMQLRGYNLDELQKLAEELRDRLLEHQRIREVFITTSSSTVKEYQNRLYLDNYHLARANTNPAAVRSRLSIYDNQPQQAGYYTINGIRALVTMKSKQGEEYDLWTIRNVPVRTNDGGITKLEGFARLERELTNSTIARSNQQYQMNVIYTFIGSSEQARIVFTQNRDETAAILPLGYSIERSSYSWARSAKTDFMLLVLIIIIIYIICSVLLESLLQPLVVISLIPVGFIGVFLTVHILNFGKLHENGLFASMILLCGLIVNSSLYVINDYNNLRRRINKDASNLKNLYLKAFNMKIIPIMLTIISTFVGLLPFLLAGKNERFWFPLAACTIGGLLFSVVGLILFMPLFMKFARIRRTDKELK